MSSDASAVLDRLSPAMRDTLRRALEKDVRADAEPIALIGAGCRLPGSITDTKDFWHALVDQKDVITEVPPGRWNLEEHYARHPDLLRSDSLKWGGFIDNPAEFDADFFGISKAEATAMDPQHRILLEVTWEALQNAGVPTDSLATSHTAVVVGMTSWDYTILNLERRSQPDAYLATGNPHSTAVGRISYLLGLRGPSLAIDTACSSSLVAVHLAAQSLRRGESDLAVAGGVQLHLSPYSSLALAKWSALSPTGRCRAFDHGANGYVRSEGCSVVVLKRLSDALRDDDRILSIIRGSAVNQDGLTNGLTAPSKAAQADLITRALNSCDVHPATVGLIETHGTGTPLGDPIEFDAIHRSYGDDGIDCALGAVKTNLGHLEAAAGTTGLIKASLALYHSNIPPNNHFDKWNPAISASESRFYIPTENRLWPRTDGPRRAGVSSFGISGTNAHVVLEQPPQVARTEPRPGSVVAVRVSGKTADRVAGSAYSLADWLSCAGDELDLDDVAHTMNIRRARHRNHAIVVGRDRSTLSRRLMEVGLSASDGVVVQRRIESDLRPVWLFSGQGSQWIGMGRHLLQDEPVFAKELSDLSCRLEKESGFDLLGALTASEEIIGIGRIQPALFSMQIALAELWRSYGVSPGAVIGHSMGEIAAAVVAGAIDKQTGLRIVCRRSALMQRNAGSGAMAMISVSAAECLDLIQEFDGLDIAVYASPNQTIVSGDELALSELLRGAEEQSIAVWPIKCEVASHSPQVDNLLDALRDDLGVIETHDLGVVYYSATVSNMAKAPLFDADYWIQNLRQPVQFDRAVSAAAEDGFRLFTEIAPHPLLESPVAEILDSTIGDEVFQFNHSCRRNIDETEEFHLQLESVKTALSQKDAPSYRPGRTIEMPAAPWRHSNYWLPESIAEQSDTGGHPFLGRSVEDPGTGAFLWCAEVGTKRMPWLGEHRVHGIPVMPAACFIEMCFAASVEAFGCSIEQLRVRELTLDQMLILDANVEVSIRLACGDPAAPAQIDIHSRLGHNHWVRCVSAKVIRSENPQDVSAAVASAWGGRTSTDRVAIATTKYYALLRGTGQFHGTPFAALTAVERHGDTAAWTEISLPPEAPRHEAFAVHPVIVDAALQSLGATLSDATTSLLADATYLPQSIGSLWVSETVEATAHCYARLDRSDDSGLYASLQLFDSSGRVVGLIHDVFVRRVPNRAMSVPIEHKTYETSWVDQPCELPAVVPAARSCWMLIGGDDTRSTNAESLASAVESRCGRVITAANTDERSISQALKEAFGSEDTNVQGVIVFADGDEASDDLPAKRVAQAQERVLLLNSLVRAIVNGLDRNSPRIWLVSEGGLAVKESEAGAPGVGALQGIVRSLAFEHPELRMSMIDLDPACDCTKELLTELEIDGPEDMVAIRDRVRYVERLECARLGVERESASVRTDGSYVITGGFGGLGLQIARWLTDHDAGRLVLNGRTIPTREIESQINDFAGTTQIVIELGDVSNPDVAERLVASAEATGLQLRGVVHAAGVLDDGLFTDLTRDRLAGVWQPKVAGATALHDATLGKELDWLVLFSSMAAMIGSPGQTAYASACAFLDAMAQWRKAKGMKAKVIDWGQWSEVGLASSVVVPVSDPISPSEGVEAFETLLKRAGTRVGVARLRLDRALTVLPELKRIPYFARVLQGFDAEIEADDWIGKDDLKGLSRAEAAEAVRRRLNRRLSAIIGMSTTAAIDDRTSLLALGMDSMLAMRIKNSCRWDFGVEPSVGLLLQGASLRDLEDSIVGQLGLEDMKSTVEETASTQRAVDRAQARRVMRSKRPPNAGDNDYE